MRDQQDRTIRDQLPDPCVEPMLGLGVERRSRLVQDQISSKKAPSMVTSSTVRVAV
jgi:hypothetical protein